MAAKTKGSVAGGYLHSAAHLVDGPRQATHGDKHEFHEAAADLWNAYLRGAHGVNAQIRAQDVAQMMALLKMARTFAPGFHADNYIDGAAYTAIAGELAKGA